MKFSSLFIFLIMIGISVLGMMFLNKDGKIETFKGLSDSTNDYEKLMDLTLPPVGSKKDSKPKKEGFRNESDQDYLNRITDDKKTTKVNLDKDSSSAPSKHAPSKDSPSKDAPSKHAEETKVCPSSPYDNTSNNLNNYFSETMSKMIEPIAKRIMDKIAVSVTSSFSGPNDNPDDYILKSQIVPQVYPITDKCSMCSANGYGVCGNCGGGGGNGVAGVSSGGSGVAGSPAGMSQEEREFYGKNGLGGVTNNVVNTTGDIAESALKNVGTGIGAVAGLGKDVIDTTGSTLQGLGSGVKDVANNTLGVAGGLAAGGEALVGAAGLGAYNLANNAGQGAYNLATGEGRGLNANKAAGEGQGENLGLDRNKAAGEGQGGSSLLSTQNPKQLGQGGGGAGGSGAGQGGAGGAATGGVGGAATGGVGAGQGTGVPGVDNYSAYGALVPKGSDFLPMTADFSAFRK